MVLKWLLHRLLGGNPILDLAKNVTEQKLSFEAATQIASSAYFLEKIDSEHCRQANDEMCRLLDQDLQKASIVSHLNLTCIAKIGVGDSLSVQIQMRHAILLVRQKQYNLAIPYLSIAADLCAKNGFTECYGSCNKMLGLIHLESNENELALKHYYEARGALERLGMSDRVAECNQELGKVNLSLGELEKAKEFFDLAQKAFLSLGACRVTGCFGDGFV